ncbi:LytTR family DNA-binding domain-containing protein [Microbulbifer sp. MLAF003]|uniref:LytR/AlgR family response regulator transcription factor n=1 Tax=unclassified Microbulbifer TaxID=2619833 RepID=UPI0024AE3138|nr:LytTR family DNA-binding domain-containing protein [Microbulbifer sp. MLAF003]WHI53261.1 LytTR family DNA-binding domain-containing protein [Microbulbifer sp. MLAF003]
MKAIIIEDSRLARNELRELLKPYKDINLVAEAQDCEQAVTLISKEQPDLIFLDINLPDGSGFDILDKLDSIPNIIFTTAYDEYAIQAFEVNALDYLLKPIHPEKLERAINKAVSDTLPAASSSQETYLNTNNKIFIKDGERCWLIELGRIRYFENCGNHAQVFFDNDKAFIYKSLVKVEQRLNPETFFRVNRQQIINLNFIKDIQPWISNGLLVTMTDGKEVEVARRPATRLRDMLSF